MRSSHKILLPLLVAVLAAARGYARESFVRSSTLLPRPAAPGFIKIGPVATNLWTFNALDVYDAALRRDVFYLTSFNSANHGQLIRLDYRRNRAKSWTLPVGIGSWGIIQGRDGNLYLGSYNGAELLCFDPQAEKWIPLPQLSAALRKGELLICDLAQAPDGDIYYGTYPDCRLVCYNPRTRQVTDIGKISDESYLRNVSVTAQGIVLCSVGMRRGRIIAWFPKTRRFETITPAAYQRPGDKAPPVVTSRYILEPVPGNLLVYDARSLKLLHVFPSPGVEAFDPLDSTRVVFRSGHQALKVLDLSNGSERIYCRLPAPVGGARWYLTRSGDLFGTRIQSYAYYQIRSRQLIRNRIPVDGLGQDVLWLRAAPDGLIYGGPSLGQTLFSYNSRSHELKSYDQVIDQGGEIYYAVPYHGKIYSISYIQATLAVFDPSKPWNQGDTPRSNPRRILSIPDDQWRPVGGIHLGPDGKMYIGTQPNYGMLGGALSVFDPATGKLQVYRNLVPQEEISAVAAGPRYVFCGADPGGGMGSKPVARHSHFIVWDPGTRKTIFDRALATNKGLGAIATTNGRAYFVAGDQLMSYDARARVLTAIYRFDRPRPVPLESLQAARDGTLWGILGGELAHINPEKRSVHFFQGTSGKATSGVTISPEGTVYFGAGTEVWIFKPKSPARY